MCVLYGFVGVLSPNAWNENVFGKHSLQTSFKSRLCELHVTYFGSGLSNLTPALHKIKNSVLKNISSHRITQNNDGINTKGLRISSETFCGKRRHYIVTLCAVYLRSYLPVDLTLRYEQAV